MPDSQEYLWIHEIPKPTTPTLQPKHVKMPPEPELMELDTPEDISDLIDVPKKVLSVFNAWAHNVLDYQW